MILHSIYPAVVGFDIYYSLTADMRERQESYIAGSKQVTREMVERWPWHRRLRNNAIAMFGPAL